MKVLLLMLGVCLGGNAVLAAEMPLQMPADGKVKCGSCHDLERSGIGPAWKDVAAKYKGKKDAEKTLVTHITQGGKFGWFPDKPNKPAMPARGKEATDAQIAALAKFIAVEMNKPSGKK